MDDRTKRYGWELKEEFLLKKDCKTFSVVVYNENEQMTENVLEEWK
ncbi:hypothetical protein LR69_04156 [Geobacillus sp. BCO2]|nr:hypothetical protein LR69_04156 [Geobacillus sp. BCO2]